MLGAFRRAAVAIAAGPLLIASGAAGDEPINIPADTETAAGGVPVACTGIGQTKLDPRWTAYPVRVEFSDSHDKYLTDVEITVWDARGRSVLSVKCAGPWILLRPAPGAYRIEGRLLDVTAAPRTAPFKPPAKGQIRLVLKFPDV